MERVRLQAKEMLPSVYLTLLSMIQALALEALWSAINERSHLWSWDAIALVGWLQVTATFQVIFFIWVAFTHLVIRIRWVMSVWDSVIPFVFGVTQFALIGLIRPDLVHLWFYLLAITAGLGAWTSLMLTREASREPENVEVIESYGWSGFWAAYGPFAGSLLLGVSAGALVQWTDGETVLSAVFAGATNGAIFALIIWAAVAWRRLVEA